MSYSLFFLFFNDAYYFMCKIKCPFKLNQFAPDVHFRLIPQGHDFTLANTHWRKIKLLLKII